MQSVAIRHSSEMSFNPSTSLTLYPGNINVIVLRSYDVDKKKKKKYYQCKEPHMKCMLIIKSSLSRLLFLPQEHILCSVQVKPFSQNKTFVLKLLAVYTYCVAEKDKSKWTWFQCKTPKEDSCSTSTRLECTDSSNAFRKSFCNGNREYI